MLDDGSHKIMEDTINAVQYKPVETIKHNAINDYENPCTEEKSFLQKRLDSPVLSVLSMKSDKSFNMLQNGDYQLDQGSDERSDSSASSMVSLKSDKSMNMPIHLKNGDSLLDRSSSERSDSLVSSMVSLKSDKSMNMPIHLKNGYSLLDQSSSERSDSSAPSMVSLKSDKSMNMPIHLKNREPLSEQGSNDRLDSSVPSLLSLKSDKSMNMPIHLKNNQSSNNKQDLTAPKALFIKHKYYRSTDTNRSHQRHDRPSFEEIHQILKSRFKKNYQCVSEGLAKQGNPTLLNEIYTELYITESESGDMSYQHEVRQIEKQSRRTTTGETPIKCNDIFKPLPEQHKHIRSVLTKGVAGIGKTVSVQKFILDWAEEKENQDIHLIFPLPFREINLMKDKTLSLLDLLHLFFPETKEMEIFSDEYKVLFIFDGLDECRLSLDFHSSVRLCDVSESSSVDVMLTNLIKGNLLPSALIWITSRPAAADLIPHKCVDRVTEVRGFSDPQKEEYFRKRISDEILANTVISHLKSSRSLYIMCHIPVFCWISVTVLEKMLSEAESQEIPKTLTQMYTHFLIIQTNIKNQKDYEKKVKDEDMIFKLGKLAFEQLVKGNLIFYDKDLRDSGFDVAEASVYSGLCTQIFREELGLYQGKVYCFVHLTIQEHLAAVHAHLSFAHNNRNVFEKSLESGNFSEILERVKHKSTNQDSKFELHQRAVDEALKSKNGHLDLFLRFILGLSLESNQILLNKLLRQVKRCSYKKQETVEYIKQKMNENLSTEKSINLIHCLDELGDPWVQEIQHMKFESVGKSKLSFLQWSALVFVLLTSDQPLDGLNLNKFIGDENRADEVLEKLKPVIKESRNVQLSYCNFTADGCVALTSALRSSPSHLRDLNLSNINLGNSGVKLISTVLENPHCKMKKLNLSGCKITDEGCVALTSALKSNPSHLKILDLSWNNLRDSGVKLLSDILKNPDCKLKILKLCSCEITAEGCVALTSALRSNPSHLTHLNLSNNNIKDSGVKLISDVLKNPQCKLEKLGLSWCNITDEGRAVLNSARSLNPSHLTDLDL